ncbi:hypothetical protein [Anaerobutyricum hallii]|uniref:Uncharacterized protein n=1 Tax=Anaerobutyricum hallii TaxID=39488 RepID=A0A374NQ70_9FIRM|nr:hypothetical protein [Anaerobutyricum hallii]RGI88036.1 hypothetical protein DXD91_07330 [Anaerobutyricum hallii]
MCIFSTPKLFAGIRKLYPEEYQLLKHDEEILEFMLDNKCDLDTFVGNAKSCVYHGDEKAIRSLVTGEFSANDIYAKGQRMYPAAAFHGGEGEPC